MLTQIYTQETLAFTHDKYFSGKTKHANKRHTHTHTHLCRLTFVKGGDGGDVVIRAAAGVGGGLIGQPF